MLLMKLAEELFPICRSITGNGVRETLRILADIVPLTFREYASGTSVFDWTIPKEWNIKDAYVKDFTGKRIIDFKKSNLHVLGYSTPIHEKMSGTDLKKNVYTFEAMPNAIPYLTSYYKERWGFCLEHERLAEIRDDQEYDVCIDSTLEDGYLTLAEGYIKGKSEKEIFLSTYICHPSMANNELSGPLVQTEVYRRLLEMQDQLNYSYRFVYAPETIGSITYLAHFGEILKKNMIAGYVVTCCGDEGDFTYLRSRRHDSLADKSALNYLRSLKKEYTDLEWLPNGSDERQYCSLGFNLPVGSLMKTKYGQYPEYHTSFDNLELISERGLNESVDAYMGIIRGIELNKCYLNLNPCCEPQLGKRGLYPTLGSVTNIELDVNKIIYMLAYADGETDLFAIADKLGIKVADFAETIDKLFAAELIE